MDSGGRSTVVIWLVAAALAVFAATRLFGGGGAEPPAVRMEGGGARPSSRSHTTALYVHLAGAVRRPGLLRLPADTRVAGALKRAGGPTRRADLTAVNL